MYVFLPFTQKYDAKVDLWSVGAVLYKCLVGQCGFYAVSTPKPLWHVCPLEGTPAYLMVLSFVRRCKRS